MRYLLTIYTDESRWTRRMTPEDSARLMADYGAFGEEAQEAGVLLGGEGLQPTATATTVRVRDGETIAHRRAVRRDARAARRLLPARVRGPRRGDRAGRRSIPDASARRGRGAPGHGLRGDAAPRRPHAQTEGAAR